jgi:hypothetical protein
MSKPTGLETLRKAAGSIMGAVAEDYYQSTPKPKKPKQPKPVAAPKVPKQPGLLARLFHRSLDDNLDALQKAVGAERPGHKYFKRVPKAGGGFQYEYQEPGQAGKVPIEDWKSYPDVSTLSSGTLWQLELLPFSDYRKHSPEYLQFRAAASAELAKRDKKPARKSLDAQATDKARIAQLAAESKKSLDALNEMVKSVTGAERPGHKYIKREPGAKGYKYVYTMQGGKRDVKRDELRRKLRGMVVGSPEWDAAAKKLGYIGSKDNQRITKPENVKARFDRALDAAGFSPDLDKQRSADWSEDRDSKVLKDTGIIPSVIAMTVVESVMSHYPGVLKTSEGSAIATRLMHKAEEVYANNSHFAKKLNGKGNKGRDTLYAFMQHWCAAELKEANPTLWHKIETEHPRFALGQEL